MEPDRLRSVPIFADLTDQELAKLSEAAETLVLGADKVLTSQDEYAFKFFVILSGRASVWQQGRRIRELGPGDFFGEVGLLTSGKRTATVATDTEIELMVLMEWDLHMIEKEWPSVGRRIRRTLQDRLEADRHGSD